MNVEHDAERGFTLVEHIAPIPLAAQQIMGHETECPQPFNDLQCGDASTNNHRPACLARLPLDGARIHQVIQFKDSLKVNSWQVQRGCARAGGDQ